MPVRGYAQFLDEHRRRPYEAILYQVGNNPDYHREMYWLLRQQPGVVVLHEYMLHDLVRHAGTADDFIAAMRYSYGLAAEQTAREMVEGHWPNERWSYPLLEPVVDAADHLIVHGAVALARVLRSRPAAGVSVVPLTMSLDGLPAVSDASRRALRHELGIGEDALMVASFGHVTPIKRIEVGLRAFARLRRRHHAARYVLAGEISPHYPELREIIAGPLGEGVIVTGRLAFPRMLELMEATDVAFNLRSQTAGETSAICVRLLGLATPVIVNEGGWFSEIPDGCCARVSVGVTEEDELVAVLEVLAGDPALRQEMGRAAAVWAARTLSFEKAVDGYTAVLERAIHEGLRPGPAVYIEPPPPDGRAATGLVRDVAAVAAGLGVRDDDEVLLPSLVDTMVTLGLTDPAVAAVGSASAARPELPRSQLLIDDHQVSPLNEGWQLAPPEGPDLGTGWRKRLRGFVWNFAGPLFQRQQTFNATLVARGDEMARGIDGVSASIKGVSDELWKRWEATEARFQHIEELRTTVGHVQHAALTLERELRRVTVGLPDAPSPPVDAGPTRVEEALDAYTYVGFENRFRGSEAEIRGRQVDYAPLFDGASNILDVGCGRGEFLDVLRERGITARGLDLNGEMVEVCRSHGLEAEVGDALAYLRGLPDASLGGMFAAQVIEHLDPQYLIRLLAVAFQKLRPGSKNRPRNDQPAVLVRLFRQLSPRHHPRAAAASRHLAVLARGQWVSAHHRPLQRAISRARQAAARYADEPSWADGTVERPDKRRRGAQRERRQAEPPTVHPHGLRGDRGTPLSVSRSGHCENTRRRGGVRSEWRSTSSSETSSLRRSRGASRATSISPSRRSASGSRAPGPIARGAERA